MRPPSLPLWYTKGTFQFTHPRGVRQLHRHITAELRGFQFTHPRGVRPICASGTASAVPCFNSRTREGCDPWHLAGCRCGWRFNSRTREGCDVAVIVLPELDVGVSIHAPARGATLCATDGRRDVSGFNSRTREGCDACLPREGAGAQSFNSRTREGCDCRNGEEAVGLPLQTCFSEGTQIIRSIRCHKHLNSYNRMSMSACECLANS